MKNDKHKRDCGCDVCAEGLAGDRPSINLGTQVPIVFLEDCEGAHVSGMNAERKFVGLRIVWGVREPKLIIGAVEGRQRLRMRNTAPAKLFVKTAEGVRCFVLEDREHYWFVNPRLEQGRNVRYRYEPTQNSNL